MIYYYLQFSQTEALRHGVSRVERADDIRHFAPRGKVDSPANSEHG